MRILVTGASGYTGASIFTNLRKEHEVTGTFHRNKLFEELLELDVANTNEVLRIVSEISPDLIIHTAAIPSRRICESNPEEAFNINAQGTKNVVDAANENNAKIYYISTLGVVEEPETQYGKTKLVGEKYIQTAEYGYNILRSSMTFGYSPNTINDRPFNRIIKTIRGGEPRVYDNG